MGDVLGSLRQNGAGDGLFRTSCSNGSTVGVKGAERIHVVDLNGAVAGKPFHQSLIKEMVRSIQIPIEVVEDSGFRHP